MSSFTLFCLKKTLYYCIMKAAIQEVEEFMIADNPLASEESYIIVSGDIPGKIRISDWAIIEGALTLPILKKAEQWYQSYLRFLDK